MAEPGADDADEDSEWRFSLDEVGPEADEDGEDAATDRAGPDDPAARATDAEDGGEGALGTFSPSKRIEPEEIDLEHAAFVVLGVLLTVAFFWYLLP